MKTVEINLKKKILTKKVHIFFNQNLTQNYDCFSMFASVWDKIVWVKHLIDRLCIFCTIGVVISFRNLLVPVIRGRCIAKARGLFCFLSVFSQFPLVSSDILSMSSRFFKWHFSIRVSYRYQCILDWILSPITLIVVNSCKLCSMPFPFWQYFQLKDAVLLCFAYNILFLTLNSHFCTRTSFFR